MKYKTDYCCEYFKNYKDAERCIKELEAYEIMNKLLLCE